MQHKYWQEAKHAIMYDFNQIKYIVLLYATTLFICNLVDIGRFK
jgi:hypothetical protein